jgi:hypothetical protein
MKGRGRVGEVVFFEGAALGDSGVYIPGLGVDLAVGLSMRYLRYDVRVGPDLSVTAAVCEGRRLK